MIGILPPTKLLAQINKLLLWQRFCKNVCHLLLGVDGLDIQRTIRHKTPEVMILQDNMFCAGGKLWTLCYSDAAAIVVPNRAKEAWLFFIEFFWKEKFKLYNTYYPSGMLSGIISHMIWSA